MLPRLPEGTRCGELVMGKYGLYDPKVRKLQDELWVFFFNFFFFFNLI